MNLFFAADHARRKVTEYGATHIENIVRSERSLPLRQVYEGRRGDNYYEIEDVNFDYSQKHNIHQIHNVKPIKKRKKRKR